MGGVLVSCSGNSDDGGSDDNKSDLGSGGDSGDGSGLGSEIVAVTGISFDKVALTVYVGETAELTAIVEPPNATIKDVDWDISYGSDLATISKIANDKIRITGKIAGNLTVLVRTKDGNITSAFTISIKDKPDSNNNNNNNNNGNNNTNVGDNNNTQTKKILETFTVLDEAPTGRWLSSVPDDKNYVTLENDVVTIKATDKSTAAIWILPEAITTGTYVISADIAMNDNLDGKSGFTALKLSDSENKECAGICVRSERLMVIRTDGFLYGDEMAGFVENTEFHISAKINLDKRTISAKVGDTELPAQIYTNGKDIRVISFHTKGLEEYVIKNMNIKKIDYTEPELGFTITLPPQSEDADIGELAYDIVGENIVFTAPSGRSSYAWLLDGALQSSTTNTLTLPRNRYEYTSHVITVVVDGLYSANYILK